MNKKMLGLFIFVFALVLSLNTLADSPKKGLIEEGTNTYCGPCASQNPTFKAWVLPNLDVLVPVVYHPNWPGNQDIFYLDNPTMHQYRVATYYQISGVPYCYFNGTQGLYPANAPAQINLTALRGQTSPLTITIDETRSGNSASVKVTVHSSQAMSGKKLRIVVNEYYIQHNAPNGETEFYWVARQMLPDHFGVDFSIGANETKEFNQNYQLRSPWDKNQIYVAAFVQDDATHEVYQAEHNLKTIKAIMSVDNPYLTVASSSSIDKTFLVENPTNASLQVKLSISTTGSFIPTGWEAKLDQYSLTIPANGSKNVKLTIKANSDAGFCAANIIAEPTVTSGIAVNSQLNIYALSDNTENAMFVGTNKAVSLPYGAIKSNPTYGPKTAAMPLSKEVLINYPIKDFDLIFLTFDYQSRSYLTNSGLDYVETLIQGLNDAIAAGKKILITGELELYNAGQSYCLPAGRSFLNSTLGLTYNGNPVMRFEVNSNNQITAIKSFSGKGMNGDPISNGLSMTLNDYTSLQSDPWIWFTDIIRTLDTKAVPFFYLDNDMTKIGGARIQNGASKAVFLSFGFEAIKDQTQRNQFMSKILDWLFSGGSVTIGPKAEFSNSSLDFDVVNVGESADQTMTIKNTGDEDLVVTKMEMDADFDPDGVFKFKSGNGVPVTLAPGETINVVVSFAPVDADSYLGNITIESNSVVDGTYLISLDGIGRVSQGAIIESDKTTLNFSNVESGSSRMGDVVIYNTGNVDLDISKIEIANNSNNAFSIIAGGDAGSIAPDGDRTITVKFAPTNDGDHTGDLVITSNAANDDGEYTIQLVGSAFSSVPEEVTSTDGMITLKATPNPMGYNGVITYTLKSNGDYNMYLVDLSGRVVTNFVNASVISGTHTFDFNTSSLSSGTYVIVSQLGNSVVKLPIIISK